LLAFSVAPHTRTKAWATARPRDPQAQSSIPLMDPARHRDGRLPQHMRNLCVLQSGSVVLKRQVILARIEMKAPQAVCVRKLAETPQLIGRKRGLQFVGNFDECHVGIIAARRK
jgi:hypothetical protein